MLERIFWKNALIRSVKTVAQSAVALLATNTLGVLDVDWLSLGSVSLLAGVISILTSLATVDDVAQTEVVEVEAYKGRHAE